MLLDIIMILIGIICIITLYLIHNKKNNICNIKELNQVQYSSLVFNLDISKVDKEKIEQTLKNAYDMKKSEEDLLHKYLTLFWAIEAAFFLAISQLVGKMQFPIPQLVLLVSIFISVVGFVFTINYQAIINTSNSIILNFKYHIIFLEHYLNCNLYNIFLCNQFTRDIEAPIIKVYKSLSGLIMLWEVAIGLEITYLITTGRFAIFNTNNTHTQVIMLILIIFVIDIIKTLCITKNNNVKSFNKVKIANDILAFKIKNINS